jgi:hypothetical protein
MQIVWSEASGSTAAEHAEIYLAFHTVFGVQQKLAAAHSSQRPQMKKGSRISA